MGNVCCKDTTDAEKGELGANSGSKPISKAKDKFELIMKAVQGKEKFIVRIQSHIRKYKVRKEYGPKLEGVQKNKMSVLRPSAKELKDVPDYSNPATI
jgi:hypothetical protein